MKSVDPSTLRQWIAEGSATLVDVREPAEHRTSWIAGARLMPLASVDAVKLPATGRIVIHCQKGGRGAAACEKLLQQNPALEIYNLAGGLEGWNAAGLPVEHGTGRVLPLDRQVQLTIGILLLAGAALSLLVDPSFVWLSAFLGAGLTMAGLTGFCGLARVMARMPWNR